LHLQYSSNLGPGARSVAVLLVTDMSKSNTMNENYPTITFASTDLQWFPIFFALTIYLYYTCPSVRRRSCRRRVYSLIRLTRCFRSPIFCSFSPISSSSSSTKKASFAPIVRPFMFVVRPFSIRRRVASSMYKTISLRRIRLGDISFRTSLLMPLICVLRASPADCLTTAHTRSMKAILKPRRWPWSLSATSTV
jgi:hypothetical protein